MFLCQGYSPKRCLPNPNPKTTCFSAAKLNKALKVGSIHQRNPRTVPELTDEAGARTCPQALSSCKGPVSHGQKVHLDFSHGLAFAEYVTDPGSFCLIHSSPKHWDAEICSKERMYLQGNQARRLQNNSQICLPKGKGLRVFVGWRIKAQGTVIVKRYDNHHSVPVSWSYRHLHIQKVTRWTHTCPVEGLVVPSSFNQLS